MNRSRSWAGDNRHGKNKKKFMQVLDDPMFTTLHKVAKKRGITIQEMLRAIVIPEWLEERT